MVLFYLYARLIEGVGGFTTEFIRFQWLEFSLIAYLYGLLYLALRPGRWRILLAALPILLLYLIHDAFFLVYGKVIRLANLSEVPELLQILSPMYSMLLVVLIVTPLVLIARNLEYRRFRRITVALAPLLLLGIVLKSSPAAFASSFETLAHNIVKYSDAKSVENNGRLAMLLYHEAQRTMTLAAIAPYRERNEYDARYRNRIAQLQRRITPRNVHLIVLESFLDPRLFRKLKFSRSPVHPDFEKLFGNQLGLSRSPVFGGATAQAEFEILCGVPALEQLSSIEFNVFTGSPAHCLPDLLGALGYRSVAGNAYKPNFFNAQAAYAGMGFAEQYFPIEFYAAGPTYLKTGNPGPEEYLFDADLFAQNLSFVEQHLHRQPDTPLFNYLLTIYGHTPHVLDPEKRPPVIQTQSDFSDDHLQRAVNQFYYRTQAIADYVQQLLRIDHNSLIILISDHVPPLRYGPNTYESLSYLDNRAKSIYYNRIAVLDKGKPIRPGRLHHYDLPDLILDYLSNGKYCANQSCAWLTRTEKARETHMNEYLTLIAHASE
jgi:phosphoglycerol transferase MdoB-like AlkP superfamily enzyme